MDRNIVKALIVKAATAHVVKQDAHNQTRDVWLFYVKTVRADAIRLRRFTLASIADEVFAEAQAAPSINAYRQMVLTGANVPESEDRAELPRASNTGANSQQLILDIMGVR